jgi:hypothetical protein
MTLKEQMMKLQTYKMHEGEDTVYIERDDVLKALEQESVLDKIRAEIEQNAYPIVHGVNNHEKGMTLYGILQIIDKYKVESEE